MYLNKIDDPRSPIDKARRPELIGFAKANGITAIEGISLDHPAMSAVIIRRELKARGLYNIRIPRRDLGSQTNNNRGAAVVPSNRPVPEVNADDDMMRQLREQVQSPAPPPAQQEKPKRLMERPKQEINLLRDHCKALGIKMDRRDNKDALKAKIEAHGQQNAAQFRQ